MIANIRLQRIVMSDILIFGLIYLIPTISHLLDFPLYLLDPMRLAVLGSAVFVDKRNAFLLAFTLPLFSCFVGGHPVALKGIIIGIELMTNLAILSILEEKIGTTFWTVLLSIAVSKVIYYSLKFGLISMGLFNGRLLATDIIWQIGVAMIISFVYVYINRRKLL